MIFIWVHLYIYIKTVGKKWQQRLNVSDSFITYLVDQLFCSIDKNLFSLFQECVIHCTYILLVIVRRLKQNIKHHLENNNPFKHSINIRSCAYYV